MGVAVELDRVLQMDVIDEVMDRITPQAGASAGGLIGPPWVALPAIGPERSGMARGGMICRVEADPWRGHTPASCPGHGTAWA